MPIRDQMSLTIRRQSMLAEMYMELWALNRLVVTSVPSRKQVKLLSEIQIEAVRREAIVLQRALKDLL